MTLRGKCNGAKYTTEAWDCLKTVVGERLCSLFGGSESIRDYIAFPKNNAGRDVMLDAPGYIDQTQLDELYLSLVKPE